MVSNRSHIFPKRFDQPLFADVAVDHVDDEIRQVSAVVDLQLIAIQMQEIVGRFERGPLVALQERMIASEADKQRNRQNDCVDSP